MPTLPISLELTIYSGTTFKRIFRWLPYGNDPQDFTGWSASMRFGPIEGAPLLTLMLTAGIGLSHDGLITVTATPSQTALLRRGTYVYNLDLINPDGEVLRFMRGRAEVIKDLL